MLSIRRVAGAEEFLAVARFRYRIYVEEMQRPQQDADHESQTIIDALDAFGCLYAAWDGAAVVGTVRTNYLWDGNIGSYFDYYALHEFAPHDLATASITTRLMVAEDLRRTSLGVRLACATYREALHAGIETDVIDCNDHLVPLFTGLGYQLHRDDLVHPEYGAVTVMKLPLRNLDHLTAIRSPFARVFRETEHEATALLAKVLE